MIKKAETGKLSGFYDKKALGSIKESIATLNGVSTKNVRQQVAQLTHNFKELTAEASESRLKKVGSLTHQLGESFSNLTRYVSGAMIVRSFWNSLREGFTSVRELDSAIATLKITMTSFTNNEFNTLINKSQELSKNLKANVNDVLTAVKTVANENETMDSIMAKTTPAVILSNVSGLGTNQTVEMIQGAMQQFDELADQSAESALKVSDSMISISRSLSMDFGTGLTGMAEGVEILGSLGNQVGMGLDETLSILSATAEKTRLSYSEIANALKTTISRTMRVADPDGEITPDDMLKTESALHSIQVAIRGVDGEMRPFLDIIGDLSGKWDGLTSAQQQYVAESATAAI